MSTKRAKLTAGKARERIASLEESITARQQRLDQLEARLERSESPDERLLNAKERLERRLTLERDQLHKLVNLLERSTGQPEESGEFFGSEEIDDLHRSFEEVRQNMAQMQARMESSELPRDLSNRLSTFEERIARREEVDSELYTQVLSLQTALDQERQTVRRLSRRIREQDQSLDALREAVEDSVVATVDLAERLDELEESLNDPERKAVAPVGASPPGWNTEIEVLRELAEDARRGLVGLQRQVVDSLALAAAEREELRQQQAAFSASVETEPSLPVEQVPSELVAALLSRLEALESSVHSRAAALDHHLVASPAEASQARGPAEAFPRSEELTPTGPKPATFAKNGARNRQVALFGARAVSHD